MLSPFYGTHSVLEVYRINTFSPDLIYGLRNQELVHPLCLIVTVWQKKVGNINRAEKLTILCFRDKNIFLWILIEMNFLENIKVHMDLWVRVFGWRSLHSEGTFCELAFLFSEPIQTWNWQCASFYFPEPDLGFVGESVILSY